MEYNFRTSNNLEDLDILDEIHSYDSVGHAVENHNIWEEEYKDADLYVMMIDNNETEELVSMIKSTGYSAYLEFEDFESGDVEVIKVNL